MLQKSHARVVEQTNKAIPLISLHDYFLHMQEGRLYPECIPVDTMEHVLDVGCGEGEWIFDLAKQYPRLHIYGVDADEKLLHKAQLRRNIASLRQIELRHADLLHGLPFNHSFVDFVHMRCFSRMMRPSSWFNAFRDCVQVLRPGGWITIVELELCEISAPACQTLYHSALKVRARLGQTLDESGLSFGLAQRLYGLLMQEPLEDVGYDLHTLDLGYLGGSKVHLFLESLLLHAIEIKPLVVQQRICTSCEFDMLVAQARQELDDPMLCGWALLVSAYGRKVKELP